MIVTVVCILMVEWLFVQVNKTLLWLSLGGNWIGAEGVWALAESLRHNSSLQWLGLGGNDLGDRGALHLASLLQGNYTLAVVLLSLLPSVSLGTSPSTTSPSLAGNVCSLQSLGLGGNDIHDEGAIHLAQALKTNTRLCSLGLGGNQIGRNIMLQSH